ncbi:hypothetical protein OJ997_29785 [Solirubrobacter phytolaccae]|uniref:DUF2750 domain-containing protein n=1 Tax=Solirubrobacter phytolaccae TaxID=1404360 RepID=A0A9X3NEC2_9ACTN|nr:hypothetical protein [Solirubrobacter phytolaccae]MDA0184531.1 hypothetical protein [Solirubrobacter phytolaccae]
MSTTEELQKRYDAWVDAVLAGGEIWIVGDDEHNTVFEDPEEDRDLNLLFSSRADAERHPEHGQVQAPPLPLADFPEVLDRVEARGEGLALWHGESWIVADPGPLAAELRERRGP